MSEPRLPPEVVGDAYTSDFSWNLLEELVEIENRMAGQEGEHAGAELLRDTFEELGFRDVEIEEFEIPGWWRGSSSLTLPDRGKSYSAQHQLIALPGTSAGDVAAELVDVGYGIPEEIGEEVDGKVAMARSDTPDDYDRWHHRMEKYSAAANNGAVGFIFRNHVDGNLPPTGEVGYHNRPGPIPAVGASKELGARLARYCEDGNPDVELSVDCRNEPTTSPNTMGVIGPDTDEEVLVTAHVDAHDIVEGASDNGVGSVLVPEIGRLLKQVEDELDTKVRLMPFGSEEIGLWGAYHFADTRDLENVKCVVNIDGAGPSREAKIRRTNSFDSVEPAFERAADRLGVPLGIERGVSPHGDSWPFAEQGVPAVTVGSGTEESGRGWGHTHADTLDKLDPRDLRAITVVFAEAVLELADDDTELERKTPEDIRDRLDESYVTEMKAGGRWRYD
ncbi:MAG: M28 family metallopeptidase [Halobacteriales archaeon]|nr:M28 family metallopeptidase [Halobacteriales archaeon]